MNVKLLHGDCLELLPTLPDNSVDAIVTDPPYFKVKKEKWDRQWNDAEAFLSWLDEVAAQWQRVLKPNGSLYCFASPRMAARVEVMLGARFNVLSNIVWAKPENPGFDGWKGKTSKDSLRQWYPYSERIIFCEHYGADNIAKGEAGYGAKCDELWGFVFEPLRAYLDGERQRAGLTPDQVNLVCGFREKGGMAGRHWFNASQFAMPTAASYAKVQAAYPGYFTREYEDLRREYEDLRRPFSVTADVPYTDVWTFATVKHYPNKHPCEKPQDLLRHIITASSREGAVVLDSFMGTGSAALACMETGRDFIGIELEHGYFDIAQQRINKALEQQPILIPS